MAFTNRGGGLQVLNVANPSNPVPVAQVATGSDPQSVQIDGHLLYLVGNTTQVFDISNPAAPRLVSTVATRGVGAALAGKDLVTIDAVSDTLNVSNVSGYAFGAVVEDPAHARLFAIDATGSDVLVYGTDANGTPVGAPTYVLGLGAAGAAVSQSSIAEASALAYDPATGRLFVADSGDNRVLVFDTTRLASGMAASAVLGQATFASSAASAGQAGLTDPTGLAYDPATGRLYVADSGDNRVLVFDTTRLAASGMAASAVLGQAGFAASAAATTQAGLTDPTGLAYDPATGRLYVADSGDDRVLVFDTTQLASGMAASAVLGQVDFTQTAPGSSASGLNDPTALAVDAAGGRLFVVDSANNRVLTFLTSTITNGMAAADVLGAPATPGFAGLSLNDATGVSYDAASNRLVVAAGGGAQVVAASLQVGNVQVETSTTGSATILWTTDTPCTILVAYGPTVAYGATASSSSTSTSSLSHSVTLTGLNSGVTYHFRVFSYDANGDLDASQDLTFTMP